jgi:hypothetical protein
MHGGNLKRLEHCYVSYVSPSNHAVLPTQFYCRSLTPQAPWWHYPILKYPPPFPDFFSGNSLGVRLSTSLVFFKIMFVSRVLKIVSFITTARRVSGRCCWDLDVYLVVRFLTTLSKSFLYFYACGAFLFSVYIIFVYAVAKYVGICITAWQ